MKNNEDTDPFILAKTKFYNERLVQARKKYGFETITEAANAIGVSVATLGNAERMSIYPQIKTAERIADFYCEPIEWLFSEKYKVITAIRKSSEKTYLEQSISEKKFISLGSKEAQGLLVSHDDNLGETLNQSDLRDVIKRVVHKLKSERERYVIMASFGIDQPQLSYKEIANELNLTQQRVRQIREKAIRRLRHKTINKELKMWA